MGNLLNEKQLCEQLQIHRNTLRMWRMRGCPYRGAERSYRYDPEAVLRWREQKGSETPGGTEALDVQCAKDLFLEGDGKDLYRQIDSLRDRLPDELQEEFETWAGTVIHEAFAAGWRAAK